MIVLMMMMNSRVVSGDNGDDDSGDKDYGDSGENGDSDGDR